MDTTPRLDQPLQSPVVTAPLNTSRSAAVHSRQSENSELGTIKWPNLYIPPSEIRTLHFTSPVLGAKVRQRPSLAPESKHLRTVSTLTPSS